MKLVIYSIVINDLNVFLFKLVYLVLEVYIINSKCVALYVMVNIRGVCYLYYV